MFVNPNQDLPLISNCNTKGFLPVQNKPFHVADLIYGRCRMCDFLLVQMRNNQFCSLMYQDTPLNKNEQPQFTFVLNVIM